jgi:hydroxypyruvate reductase
LPKCDIYEAGHPVSDENTITATQECVKLAEGLTAEDELLFLVSGGGSALFERPLAGITLDDVQDITSQLLASGADIVEMNILRKRLSGVKAGRFAQLAAPAKVFAVILSDVLGDRLDSIASGPAVPDNSTAEDAAKVVKKYGLKLTELQSKYLNQETPKNIDNVETVITGSVRTLCEAAEATATRLGYATTVLTTTLNCEAAEAGRMLAAIAADTVAGRNSFAAPCAIIAGGETVVTLKGNGRGGRNQEMALAAAKGIAGLDNTLIFALGSDGTDGPTDAAGGIVDGGTIAKLRAAGIDVDKVLSDNDSYNGLKAVDGLIVTGPTGTNVNDVVVILCC